MHPQTNYEYDVYISYCEADDEWVRQQLLPRLDRAQVTYVDHLKLIAGRPKVEEIERVIDRSRRTLLILSPEYLQEAWRKFDSFLVISYGIDSQRWMAVPVVKSPCQLPRRLDALININLSTPTEPVWQQLLVSIAAPIELPPGIDHADLERLTRQGPSALPVIDSGLSVLNRLMAREDVRQAVERSPKNFKTARDQIQILADYKDLHEALHTLQIGCFAVINNSLKTFPDDEDTCDNLVAYEYSLESVVTDVQGIIKNPTFIGYQHSWVRNLTDASMQLKQANQLREAKYLKGTVWNLRTVLGEQPTRINDKLVEAARNLRLTELVFDMNAIREQMDQPEIDVGDLRSFAAAIHNLADLYHTLKSLIADHDRWQDIDIIQRRIKNSLNNDISELENSWPLLHDLTKSLYELRQEEWAVSLQKSAEALDVAVAAQDWTTARRSFQGFYSQVSDRFARVDKALKKLCDDLRSVGNMLSSILEMIQ